MARRTATRKNAEPAPPPAAATAVGAPAAPSLPTEKSQTTGAEVGISGTTNWNGRLAVESNTKLQHELAFGTPGSQHWGEYERLVKTDPDCASALEPVCAALRDARIDVEPAGDSDLEVQQAEFVEWNLKHRLEPSSSEVLQQMARRMLSAGFAIHEVVLGTTESDLLPGGFGFYASKLAERLPASVHPNGWLEVNGELSAIRQRGQKGGVFVSDLLLPAERVLLTTWAREGNNYQGVSIFRPVWYLAKIREQLLKIVGVGLQREACGVPAATATDKSAKLTISQRKSLEKLLANLVYHENAAVVMPAGWTLEWIFSPNASKGHVIDAWKELGIVILRQLQAQQQFLGTGSTGSRAVGAVHDTNQDAFALGVVAVLEGVLNGVGSRPYTGLSKRLVQLNWGPQDTYPRIVLTLKKGKLAPTDRIASMVAAKGAGILTITIDDENFVREDLGLAPISAEDRDAEKLKAPPLPPPGTAPPGAAPAAPAGAPPPQPAGAATLPPDTLPAAKLASQPGGFVPHRALRPDEQVVDFAAIDDLMGRARVDFESKAKPLVAAMLVSALPEIRKAMADGNPSAVADIKLDTSQLAPMVTDFLDGVRSEGFRQLKAEHAKGTDVAKKREQGDADTATAPVHLAAEEDDQDIGGPGDGGDGGSEPRKFLEQKAALLIRRIQGAVQIDLEREAIDGVRTGGNPNEIVTATIGRLIDSGQLRSQVGEVIPTAFNEGREDYAATQGVSTVTLSALLDGQQCEPCEDLDGETYDYGSDEHEEHTPPLTSICDGRGNCRCVLTYNFDGGSDDA